MAYQTERLYYQNNKLFEFTAGVLFATPCEKGTAVILDRTAFFPEGGGQGGDIGYLNELKVYDTQETPIGIVHYVDGNLEVGDKVTGKLDKELRLKRMRDHTGEHIISSVVHRLLGYDNVGFHMSAHNMDVDFNGDFTWEQLKTIELEANRIIRQNVAVKCYYPTAEELSKMVYRSKLELSSPRIVEIEGYDLCACCAPHASTTGEVGCLIIVDCYRNRNNMRLTLLAGEDASEYIANAFISAKKGAAILSTTPLNIDQAIEKQATNLEVLRRENANVKRKLAEMQAQTLAPTQGYLVIFTDSSSAKDLLNKGLELAEKGVCVFFGEDGSYSYMLATKNGDVKPLAQSLNAAFNGKGGGKPQSVQGRLQGNEEAIRTFINEYAEA